MVYWKMHVLQTHAVQVWAQIIVLSKWHCNTNFQRWTQYKGYTWTPSSLPFSATVSMIFFITSACLLQIKTMSLRSLRPRSTSMKQNTGPIWPSFFLHRIILSNVTNIFKCKNISSYTFLFHDIHINWELYANVWYKCFKLASMHVCGTLKDVIKISCGKM